MTNRIYLSCPFEEKDQCKKLGARWDNARKSWFITPAMDPLPFQRWWPDDTKSNLPDYYVDHDRIEQLETTISELQEQVGRIETDCPEGSLCQLPESAMQEFLREIGEWKSFRSQNPEWWRLIRPEVDPECLAFYSLSEEAKSRLLN